MGGGGLGNFKVKQGKKNRPAIPEVRGTGVDEGEMKKPVG